MLKWQEIKTLQKRMTVLTLYKRTMAPLAIAYCILCSMHYSSNR